MEINLSKAYGNNVVFKDFHLTIEDKKLNVIIGPSGCGKTTLLQCVAGLTGYEGEITPKPERIGYVFQDDRLFPYLTVYKNLEIIDNDKDKINYFLHEFQVFPLRNKYPAQLSGGERQRISLIRAFLGENELILLDEPYKSLDYFLARNLWDLLVKMQVKTQKTVILVTHDVEMAVYLGQNIHVLSDKTALVKASIENPYAFHKLNEQSLKLYNELLEIIKN